jgi:hypothetical protein
MSPLGSKRSISRAINIVGEPPCMAWSVQGPKAASVGTHWLSPTGSKIEWLDTDGPA